MLHQFINGDIRVVNDCTNGVSDFLQVVRSHIGGHTNSNSATSVCQQEREGSRKYQRFSHRIIIVRPEINCLFLDILQHLFTDSAHLSSV